MPCQCGNATTAETTARAAYDGCECQTQAAGGCACGSGTPTPSDHESSLERVVMDLDKRLRRLEASR